MFGCVLDYIGCGMLKFGLLCVVVFDEVDEMFDMGFVEDIEVIFDVVLVEC